ncbi:hypothetical protein [Phenylobacterium sp.]|uniref:hypothetical protein n=1 Tax=Phenylobacterium sp. TaxID=1871053 RepID=UPI0035B2BAE2
MKMRILTTVAACVALASPMPAAAQLGMLRGAIPGANTSSAASVDPDAFLAETVETTRYMMVAAAVLAAAAKNSQDRAALGARVNAIQSAQDVKELGAFKVSLQEDLAAISANKESAAEFEARYAKMTAEQREQVAAAAFNFALGMYRNVRLSQQAPALLDSVKTNPRLLAKAGQLKTAADLVVLQAKGTASMAGSMRQIMGAAKVAAPAEAESTKPKAIQFT